MNRIALRTAGCSLLMAALSGSAQAGLGADLSPAFTAPAKTVIVGNGDSAPVPVHTLDDSLKAVVQAQAQINITPGTVFSNGTLYVVPAGKRLVIEEVTAKAPVDGAVGGSELTLTTTAGGSSVRHFIATKQADLPRATEQVRLYADAGTAVQGGIVISTATSAQSAVFFTFSGYLVDLP